MCSPPLISSVTVQVSLFVLHIYQACFCLVDFPMTLTEMLFSLHNPSLLYFLQFFHQVLPLWGQYWLPYLKLQSSFLNSVSLLFWFFSVAVTTTDMLHNFIIFRLITSLSLIIATLWKFWAWPFGLASHVGSKSGKYLEGEHGCVSAAGLLSICCRFPPWRQGLLSLLFLDVISSTQNSCRQVLEEILQCSMGTASAMGTQKPEYLGKLAEALEM